MNVFTIILADWLNVKVYYFISFVLTAFHVDCIIILAYWQLFGSGQYVFRIIFVDMDGVVLNVVLQG